MPFFSICDLCYPCRKLSSSPLYGLHIIAPHATPLPSSPLNSVHICTAQRLISPFYSSSAEFRLLSLSCYSTLQIQALSDRSCCLSSVLRPLRVSHETTSLTYHPVNPANTQPEALDTLGRPTTRPHHSKLLLEPLNGEPTNDYNQALIL